MCRCQRIRDQKFECTHQNSPEIHGKTDVCAAPTAVVDDGVGFGLLFPASSFSFSPLLLLNSSMSEVDVVDYAPKRRTVVLNDEGRGRCEGDVVVMERFTPRTEGLPTISSS